MAPWRRRESRSHRAASDGRDAPRYHRARLGEREAPGRVRVRALERVKKKKTTVRKSRRLDPRRASGGRRLDARATEGETVSRRERGPGRGRAPRRDDVSARRAVSSGPSRALHAGFHIVRLVRFFHPGRPVRHTGPVRLRSRCPTDRPEAGRGGAPSPLPVAEGAPAPAVRPRRRPTSSPGARARVHPRERASRASSTTVARPARETHPEQAPTLDRGGARARARRVVADRRARRDATVVRGEGCGHHGAKGGGGARGFVWDGEVRRGRGVPLVRIRRALTDPRNTCWSEHIINPEIAHYGTRKQIVTVARRTPSHSAMLVRDCASYYVRVGSNIKGTDGLVVE